jgi:hypothetical protein
MHNRGMRRLAVISVVAAALLGRIAADGHSRTPPVHARILFVGNSLTTANDVPGIVEALSIAAGERAECRTVAFDGYSLEDHWNRGDARRLIAEGGWSTVVLQQGPSALPASRALLVDYAERFDADARKAGAKTALYMVWPSADRRADFDDVYASYAAAARAVGGLFLPAGDSWRTAWKRDASLALYGRDGFHPTPLGSYLAALVIDQRLSGHSPIGAAARLTSPAGMTIEIPARVAPLLQQAAADAVAQAR